MNSRSKLPVLEDTDLVLEQIFRHIPVGVLLTDLHGTIIDVNDALCRLFGFDRTDLIGRTIAEFAHPEDVGEVLGRIADLREGRAGQYVAQRRYVRRDGSTVQAQVSVAIVYTSNGEPVCGIGIIEDITERTAMESQLRSSEARYRRIIEDQTEFVTRCLPDGTRTFVNEAYCRYNGATAAELVGTSFFPCLGEEEQRHLRAKFDALTPSNPVLTDQHWVTSPTGAMRWHEWTDRGFFDEQGQLTEIQSVGRDLTEQHEKDEQLVRSEERYRRLFHSLPVAAWENDWELLMAELRRRGLSSAEAFANALRTEPSLFYELAHFIRIVGVNAAALEMAGVAGVDEFRNWLLTAWTPESGVRYGLALGSLVFGEAKFLTDEFTLIRANGERLDLLFRVARSERWGEEFMMFPIAVDITERKRIQRELEHKQELTERAEAAAHLGSWEWNPATDLVFGSAEFWRIVDGCEGGGPQERPIPVVWGHLQQDDASTAEALWNAFRAPSSEPRPAVIERDYTLVRPDGAVAIARGQSFFGFGPDGSVTRAFGILRDITDARRAEEEAARQRDELVRADKLISLGILVSGMAHEINNPNYSIGLNAPLLRDAWQGAAAHLEGLAESAPELRLGRMRWSEARREVPAMIDDIALASERIRGLVTELRTFALDHDPGELRPVSVNAIVQTSLRLVGKQIARATKRFHMNFAADVPQVLGNAARLGQVVVNLVLNACQALQSDDQAIEITTGMADERVFIRVRDEGAGMSAEHLANIRTLFFTTKRAEGGTGLGVPVSDRIATEHGGELTFESQPGRGMTATLWLPQLRA